MLFVAEQFTSSAPSYERPAPCSSLFTTSFGGHGARTTAGPGCRLPAAMAAGIIDELRDFERLYDEVTEHTYA